MGRPKGSKNSNSKKKKAEKEVDLRDDPSVTYALRPSKIRSTADAAKEIPQSPITDAELEAVWARPDWVWGGMTPTVLKLLARIEADRTKKTSKSLSPLD